MRTLKRRSAQQRPQQSNRLRSEPLNASDREVHLGDVNVGSSNARFSSSHPNSGRFGSEPVLQQQWQHIHIPPAKRSPRLVLIDSLRRQQQQQQQHQLQHQQSHGLSPKQLEHGSQCGEQH